MTLTPWYIGFFEKTLIRGIRWRRGPEGICVFQKSVVELVPNGFLNGIGTVKKVSETV